MYEISSIEASEKLKKAGVILLDVREKYEVEVSKLNNEFIHIPLHDLGARFNEIPKEKEVLVLCHHGHRSMVATLFLRKNGFNALNISGGIEAYSKLADNKVPRYEKFTNKTARVINF